jgi:hypothetical protein
VYNQAFLKKIMIKKIHGLGDLFYDQWILGLGFSWLSCYNDSPQSSKAGVWKVFVSLQATRNCAESGVAGIFLFLFFVNGTLCFVQ